MHELKSWGVILHLENWISHSENQPMKMIKCSRLVPTTIIVYDKSRKFKGERVATSCQHAHRKTAGRRQSRVFADITVSHETTPLCFVQLLLVITLWVFYECDIRHRIPLKIPHACPVLTAALTHHNLATLTLPGKQFLCWSPLSCGEENSSGKPSHCLRWCFHRPQCT